MFVEDQGEFIVESRLPEGGQPTAAWATHSGNQLKHLRDALSFVDGDSETRWGGQKHNEVLGNLGFRV